MAHLQRILTQHSSANLKNGIHIRTYYMSLLRISTHHDYHEASQQTSDVQQQQHILVARIVVHPSLNIRQQTVLHLDSIPLAIITLIRINTYYYILLRIFLQKCCFMMSFVVFTHYYVLMLVSTNYRPPLAGDPFSGRSIIGRNKH